MSPLPVPVYVAHAGGAVNGADYQNTIEALDLNYAKGFRFFELDFSWTSDRALVGIHDWGRIYSRLFVDSSNIPDLESFTQQSMKDGSMPVTFERLDSWLKNHADARVASDLKEDNLEGLNWIKHNYPLVSERIIPQIYEPREYKSVKDAGYRNIILTMYRLPGSANNEVISFAQKHDLAAVTLPIYRFEQKPLVNELLELGIPVCVHTINDAKIWQKLKLEGAECIYTDWLIDGS